MKDNTATSGSQQSSLLTSATDDEFFVAQILLDLPTMIGTLESRSGFRWGSKKRRSRSDDAPPSMSPTAVQIEGRQPQAKAAEEVAATASPVTPLAFSPSESDERSRHASKRRSKKSSREEYINMIEELTQRRDLLREEIESVTNYCNKLIAYNSELKAMKEKVLNSCLEKEEPKLEISRERNVGSELSQRHPQPLDLDLMAEKFQHAIGPITTQFGSYNGLVIGSINLGAPLRIPDLNICAEEAFGVDTSQPFDMSRAFSHKRARFAEARRRRMDIIKIKSMRNTCGIKLPRAR